MREFAEARQVEKSVSSWRVCAHSGVQFLILLWCEFGKSVMRADAVDCIKV